MNKKIHNCEEYRRKQRYEKFEEDIIAINESGYILDFLDVLYEDLPEYTSERAKEFLSTL